MMKIQGDLTICSLLHDGTSLGGRKSDLSQDHRSSAGSCMRHAGSRWRRFDSNAHTDSGAAAGASKSDMHAEGEAHLLDFRANGVEFHEALAYILVQL